MPWTWMRVLRDQGPKSRDFICAMLTLHTWMDGDGFAFPSLRTWAVAARMAVGTLRKHLKAAVDDGWLGGDVCQGAGNSWRRNTYRCAVPSDGSVFLTGKDEALSASLIMARGDISNDVSSMADTPARLSRPRV